MKWINANMDGELHQKIKTNIENKILGSVYPDLNDPIWAKIYIKLNVILHWRMSHSINSKLDTDIMKRIDENKIFRMHIDLMGIISRTYDRFPSEKLKRITSNFWNNLNRKVVRDIDSVVSSSLKDKMERK